MFIIPSGSGKKIKKLEKKKPTKTPDNPKATPTTIHNQLYWAPPSLYAMLATSSRSPICSLHYVIKSFSVCFNIA